MLPLPVKSISAERKAQNNFRFQLVTGLQPSTETCRSIPSTASQHVQPGWRGVPGRMEGRGPGDGATLGDEGGDGGKEGGKWGGRATEHSP